MFTRDLGRRVLYVLGVLAFFLAVQPYFQVWTGGTADAAMLDHLQAHPDDMPSAEEYRFGWAHSPLAHYRSERTLTVQDGAYSVSRKSETTIGWRSWSAVTLAAAVGLFWVGGRLRPARN